MDDTQAAHRHEIRVLQTKLAQRINDLNIATARVNKRGKDIEAADKVIQELYQKEDELTSRVKDLEAHVCGPAIPQGSPPRTFTRRNGPSPTVEPNPEAAHGFRVNPDRPLQGYEDRLPYAPNPHFVYPRNAGQNNHYPPQVPQVRLEVPEQPQVAPPLAQNEAANVQHRRVTTGLVFPAPVGRKFVPHPVSIDYEGPTPGACSGKQILSPEGE